MRNLTILDTRNSVELPSGKNSTVIFRQPSPLDDFLVETLQVGPEETDVITFVTSDISVLFNQQRLMQLSPMALDKIVQQLKSSAPSVNLTDEQWMQSIKSRYIQSNCDLWQYTQSIQRNIDGTVKSIQEEIARQQAEQEAQQAAQQASAAQVSTSE